MSEVEDLRITSFNMQAYQLENREITSKTFWMVNLYDTAHTELTMLGTT